MSVNIDEHVRVSDISNYLNCPRKVYYTYQGHDPKKTITPSYVAALILKEMAQDYAEVITSEEMFPSLESLLDMSARQVTTIYRDELAGIDPETISFATSEVCSHLDGIMNGIQASIHAFGIEKLLDFLTSMDSEPVLYSEKLVMSGSPDRLVMVDGCLTPSIIRTGNAPISGAWKNDRIRLTAFSILLEEKYDSAVMKGMVEYARYGIVREVPIRHADRRKVLALAGRVRKIRDGRLPERPDDAPCDYCGHVEHCQVTQTLASRFF
ncbi:MAG: Dna2/Cas4 domain-containing protein [Methanosarcinales archaeon]|nr:Dna2/Cas4 domain-containing protein [Methanosarcinales archaeon]